MVKNKQASKQTNKHKNYATYQYIIHCCIAIINESITNSHPPAELAVASEVNTVTKTFLARVPFSILTVVSTLPAPSFTEYVVWLNPIVTPKQRVKENKYNFN